MTAFTDLELAWLAGLLEGEGYFGYCGTQYVRLKMTDEDVILKAAVLCGRMVNKTIPIVEDKPFNLRHSRTYRFTLSGNSARIVMWAVVSYMGFRRRKKIWQSLHGYVQPKGSTDTAAILRLVASNGG
jgi:hypothetical protein